MGAVHRLGAVSERWRHRREQGDGEGGGADRHGLGSFTSRGRSMPIPSSHANQFAGGTLIRVPVRTLARLIAAD